MKSIESMTGYGEHRASVAGISLVCRIKSVNHRFLDLKIKLPRPDLYALEMAARKQVQQSFQRGAIELNVLIEGKKETSSTLLNSKLAALYAKEAKKLATKLGLSSKAGLSLDALLRLPGVTGVSAPEESWNEVKEDEILKKLVSPAIEQLKKSRLSEGKKLSIHLLQLLSEASAHAKKIAALEEPEKHRARENMSQRIQETLKMLSADKHASEDFAARLREEAVFWIERRDFLEERTRLEMHLNAFKQLIEKPQDLSGKKLEFLHQELLRETNTLGTKAQSHAVTSLTIEIKTVLERLKEQLANVS